MSRFTTFVGFFGVPEMRGAMRSPLHGLLMRSIFRDRRPMPQPLWVTTKETAAWRFGA
jgi:hypothetical protein